MKFLHRLRLLFVGGALLFPVQGAIPQQYLSEEVRKAAIEAIDSKVTEIDSEIAEIEGRMLKRDAEIVRLSQWMHLREDGMDGWFLAKTSSSQKVEIFRDDNVGQFVIQSTLTCRKIYPVPTVVLSVMIVPPDNREPHPAWEHSAGVWKVPFKVERRFRAEFKYSRYTSDDVVQLLAKKPVVITAPHPPLPFGHPQAVLKEDHSEYGKRIIFDNQFEIALLDNWKSYSSVERGQLPKDYFNGRYAENYTVIEARFRDRGRWLTWRSPNLSGPDSPVGLVNRICEGEYD